MSTTQNMVRAKLVELDAEFDPADPRHEVEVQFNPETMKVTFTNQVQTPGSANSQSGSQLFVGAGTTKLTLTLWFDVNAERTGDATDVRTLTARVSYFITPKPDDNGRYLPPGVRFEWGSFRFDGIMESLDENLEYFSPDGRPLRASMAVSLTQQKITAVEPIDTGAASAAQNASGRITGGRPVPGTRPLTPAAAGQTLQQIADLSGRPWQDIALANDIENPRRLEPGQLLDLSADPLRSRLT